MHFKEGHREKKGSQKLNFEVFLSFSYLNKTKTATFSQDVPKKNICRGTSTRTAHYLHTIHYNIHVARLQYKKFVYHMYMYNRCVYSQKLIQQISRSFEGKLNGKKIREMGLNGVI